MSGAMPENVRVLRFFAADKELIDNVMLQCNENSGVKAQSMVRGCETLVLIEAITKSGPATRAALSAWQDKFASATKGAFYATGDTTLAEVSMKALNDEQLIFCCIDEQTGNWVSEKIKNYSMSKKVFDFGEHSYLHNKIAQKIYEGSRFSRKYPNETAQQVAGRIKAAYKYSGSDYAIGVHQTGLENSYVFVGEKTGFWFRKVTKEQNAYLWAMDILRRLGLGLPQVKGTMFLKYGEKIPVSIPEMNTERTYSDNQDVWGENPLEKTFSDDDYIVPTEKNSGSKYIFAVLWVALFAVITLGIAYLYTGGDIASLWYNLGIGFEPFSGSSASML